MAFRRRHPGGRNLVVTLRSTDEHKRSLGEIEVEFVPYLAAELLKSLSQACVQSGLANQAADLLKEAGVEERMLPLYEALRAAAAGPGASLAHLAPEVRVPAEDLLKFLLEPAPPPTSPAVKDKLGRAGRGDRRTKRAGKEG
jgi:hypothetical protein